jgi:hypothetical protein
MGRFTFKLAVALLTFLVGITVAAFWLIKRPSVGDVSQGNDAVPVAQEKKELRLSIPADGWEPIFFKSINERAGVAGLPSLRAVRLPEDDLEVRVWAGFGLTTLRGLVLKRTSGQWSATRLEGIHGGLPKNEYRKIMPSPRSGWDVAWRRVVGAGILTLPDASEGKCNAGINDGMSYVIEINKDSEYRTYMYDNPDYAKCDEAKQMLRVVDILDEEFKW